MTIHPESSAYFILSHRHTKYLNVYIYLKYILNRVLSGECEVPAGIVGPQEPGVHRSVSDSAEMLPPLNKKHKNNKLIRERCPLEVVFFFFFF